MSTTRKNTLTASLVQLAHCRYNALHGVHVLPALLLSWPLQGKLQRDLCWLLCPVHKHPVNVLNKSSLFLSLANEPGIFTFPLMYPIPHRAILIHLRGGHQHDFQRMSRGYNLCASVCADFTISCAPFLIRRGQYYSNKYAQVMIAPVGATNVTIEFTYCSTMNYWDGWDGVQIQECSSLTSCATTLGYQSGWYQPFLLSLTSNTGIMRLTWTTSPSQNSAGFEAWITACTPCPVNTYSGSQGMTYCLLCDLGTYNYDKTGLTAC